MVPLAVKIEVRGAAWVRVWSTRGKHPGYTHFGQRQDRLECRYP